MQKYQITDDDATEIVKVLNMLNNGEILADYSGKHTLSLATPDQLKEATRNAIRSSHEEAHAHPTGTNRRKSVDMQRASIDMRAPSMGSMGGMMPGASAGSFSYGVQPGYGMAPMGGYIPTQVPAPAPATNEAVIKSLADEVQRLQQMVQEKRAREAAAGLPH